MMISISKTHLFRAGLLAMTVLGAGWASASMATPQDGYYVQPTYQDYQRWPGRGRLVCREEQVRHIRSSDHHRIAGTAIGAVAGGLLGSTIGRGGGRTLATVGGAVAGGLVGRSIQGHHQDENAYYTTERRCWRQ